MRPATDPGRIAGLVGRVGHGDGLHAHPTGEGAHFEVDHGAAVGGGAFGEDEELTVPLPPFGFGAFQNLVGDGGARVLVGARDEDALHYLRGGGGEGNEMKERVK